MQPITYQWLPGTSGNICEDQTYTANVPLTFANPVVIPKAGVAALCAIPDGPNQTPSAVKSFLTQPVGSVNASVLTNRFVALSSTSNLSGTEFTIVGQTVVDMSKNANQPYMGTIISEVVQGPNATTVDTENMYTEIYSITPNTSSGNEVSVGMSNQGVLPYIPLDRWNKNAVYTLTVDNVQTGYVTFNIYYIAKKYLTIKPSLLTTVNTNNPLLLPLTDPTFVIANMMSTAATVLPAPTTWPITLEEGESITLTAMNFPIEALVFQVQASEHYNTTFDFTVMQQGGKY